ncbi:heterokaryon incompatibility protein-domain-containing protein [Nemania sp. FL0916]|nr:heterokaryon incompatibility protein-domain-containing protein [Nemania sp. FL0916]
MRLLDVDTLELRLFLDESTRPQYAILSHRWLSDGDEVGFEDLLRYHEAKAKGDESVVDLIVSREGFKKIENYCKTAKHSHNLKWAWIDTCCIDKRSSSELSEAINSMFRWYQDAERCYVFLQDVAGSEADDSFRQSEWFTRGWTLQELLSPKLLSFYNYCWQLIGTIHHKSLQTTDDDPELCDVVSSITSIPIAFLEGAPLSDACIAKRMSWASKRNTTRPEDIAYSLLGIFDVNMPLLYGEGHKAFIRLQEEIINHVPDDSILAWGIVNPDTVTSRAMSQQYNDDGPLERFRALAASPADFADCGDLEKRSDFSRQSDVSTKSPNLDLQVTTAGIKVSVDIYRNKHYAFCELSCFTWRNPSQCIMIQMWSGESKSGYPRPRIYSQYMRVGRTLWCGSFELLPRLFLAIPCNVTRPLDIFGVLSRHRNRTITLSKDNTLGHNLRNRYSYLNDREDGLILLNLPQDHAYTIEYASPGFSVSKNTYQLGKQALQISFLHESPSVSLLVTIYFLVLSLVCFVLYFLLLLLLATFFLNHRVDPVSAMDTGYLLVSLVFIGGIIRLLLVSDTVTSSLFRRVCMFVLGKGAGLRINPRAIRACIRIEEQRPSCPQNEVKQVRIVICFWSGVREPSSYRPSPFYHYEASFFHPRVTCYLTPESIGQPNEDSSLNFDQWPRAFEAFKFGKSVYVRDALFEKTLENPAILAPVLRQTVPFMFFNVQVRQEKISRHDQPQ